MVSGSEESLSELEVMVTAPETARPRCQVARPVVPDSADEDPEVNWGMVELVELVKLVEPNRLFKAREFIWEKNLSLHTNCQHPCPE